MRRGDGGRPESDRAETEYAEVDQTARDRVTGGRAMVWFLVEGNRYVVTALLLVAAYVLLITLGTFAPGSPLKILDPAPVSALFTPVIITVIMGVSLVLTFNQLVLSQELGPIGDQRQRMEESVAFRRDVETLAGSTTSPPEPSLFLRGLLETARRRATTLVEIVDEEADGRAREAVREYATTVIDDAEQVGDNLKGQQFGEFEVVKAALEYDYSWKLYDGRRRREAHADDLSPEALSTFDDLLETIQFFGPAREHFKTLYFRWELIDVSRALVYSALPALVVGAYMLLAFDAAELPGTTAGFDHGFLFVSAAFVVGATPFTLFLAYILRIVTVAKWTLAIGPFVLRETGREAELEWP